MSTKQKIIIGYFLVGFFYALYAWFFGEADHSKGFVVQLIVATLMWPAIIFPTLGKIIGAVILLAVIALIVIAKSRG